MQFLYDSVKMYNSLMNASGYSPADKIEERITFVLSHARLYLVESMINETTCLPLQKYLIYPVAVEDLDLHRNPSLYLYPLLNI